MIKVQAEHWPPGDKGLIRAAVHQKQGQDYVMTQCGRNSNCTHENMPDYTVRIPWRSFFDGLDDIPPKAEHGAFVLDLFRLQREVNSTFKVRGSSPMLAWIRFAEWCGPTHMGDVSFARKLRNLSAIILLIVAIWGS